MELNRQAAEALAREGIDALRRGDGQTARDRLEQVAASNTDLPAPWLLLAQACRLMNDDEAEGAALEKLLAIEIRNLPALLLMGDLKARTNDDRAASSYYKSALNMAEYSGKVPENLMPMLQRAQAFTIAVEARFEAHLNDSLADLGLGATTPRIRQSLDLLLGKTEIFQQQPSLFYFPGMPQRQFYEREEFAWLEAIEAEIPAMREELIAVLAQDHSFSPYVEAVADRPRPNNPLLEDPSWSAFYLWKGGALIPENAERCPRTVAALASAPIPVIAQRSPMALFSQLKPGTHIQPHHGMLNTRLICHIPLIVPGDCQLRVGNETRAWEQGKALIFDDSIEHEAWNNSTQTRVILLFEIWRPEVSLQERAALTAIFETINEYQGAPTDPA